ncbi:MAG TPA: AraC family transcriptional regulator [Stellaceae bacterium]|nr:AraC family transcriptional regulator [Stellaceae bacterium]
MSTLDIRSAATAATAAAFAAPYPDDLPSPLSIIADETAWRVQPRRAASAAPGPQVAATRWRLFDKRVNEASAATPDDRHVIGIVLRSMNLRLALAGRVVLDGVAMPGTALVAAPGAAVRCLFRGPCDELHLHAPNHVIAECAEELPGYRSAARTLEVDPNPDPTVERLGRTLLEAEQIGGSVGRLYADCIATAIIARLLACASASAACIGTKIAPLPRWRLKRAIDYVDAHLADPVSLADLAAATGLTRMHFAAQFRATTGLRPHEYLLRRRIEQAQEMLAGTANPVVDIALSVGFQTQSHFTTVFKRFTGQPPYAWRQSRREPAVVEEHEAVRMH